MLPIQLYIFCYNLILVVRCLDKVSPSVLPYFKAVASKLIEERGAVEVLSAALAYISGVTTEMKSRSLLSSQPVCVGFFNTVWLLVHKRMYLIQTNL